MKSWFRKITEKKRKGDEQDAHNEKGQNISSLYEIVEDHLKSLDYDQLEGISEGFAERFAAHQEIISQIIRTPLPKMERYFGQEGGPETSDGFEIVDAHPRAPVGPYPSETILSHYDRMIRTQYDRLISLTVDFLKDVTSAEIERVESQTKRIDSEVRLLSDVLRDEAQRLQGDLDRLGERHLSLIKTLENSLIEQNRRMTLLTKRLWMLLSAVGVAAVVGGAALILSLIE